jgi:hypothetical protein
MKAKHSLSAAVLGIVMLTAIPAISHAQSQSEWFLKQALVGSTGRCNANLEFTRSG